MIEKEIIDRLTQIAREEKIPAYLVGGYLRDKILRRACHDLDLVVEGDALFLAKKSAKFLKVPPPVIYRRFGTAMLKVGKSTVEFAAARKESYRQDSRRPSVSRATLSEDLGRRDFTINCLAQRLGEKQITDPFGGRADIKAGVIRTPAPPSKTFYDDPLRMLRAVRFASRLKFQIEEETAGKIIENRQRLKIVSSERIADELLLMLDATRPSRGIKLLKELKLLDLVLPEIAALKNINDLQCKDLFAHTLTVLDNIARVKKDRALRIAALFHDIGKPKTAKYIAGKGWTFYGHQYLGAKMMRDACSTELKLSASDTKKISKVIAYHLHPHWLAKRNVTENAIFRFLREVGKEWKDLLLLARADITSKNKRKVEEGRARLDQLENRIKEINRKRRAAKFKLALDGCRIMEILGIKPGPQVGKIKSELEKAVMEEKTKNNKRELAKYLKTQHSQIVNIQ